ncbi:MAG TPA: hypothetical protein DCL69_04025 [Firmicutes bacterium]|nr:hypothetical protein [Bacillota bacterium]
MRIAITVLCALLFLMLTSPETMASITTPEISEMESYDRLAAFVDEEEDAWTAGWQGFAVPGLFQLRRGSIWQGTVHIAVEIGAFIFLFRRTETVNNGDTYSVLKVNWVALALLAANHTCSAYENARWALGKNAELRVKYEVDKVILGVAF